ncbi:cation-transporting P-type ATPase [Methylocaldum sp.]|uniref:cation-translocating P-type ATPase n=1 Tax=Methylocaldum sp. TaxID=1969727 RepID=UPI002D3817B3|nr:cation-transporting P-type ATPase [Methylocaldum sp.]HYE34258.1 cation-transporting P-type ATPase [Methylocaldum sp.]
MKIHHLQPDQALRSLHTQFEGLSETEAARRLHEYGANRLTEFKRESVALRFIKQFTHFFALLLWLAAGLAFFGDWKAPGEGMATLGFAIVGVILINGVFSFWQEYRAERAIAALQKLLPLQVKVMREGNVRLSEASDIVPGDVILLQEGDNIPADCRLLEAFALRVNNATVTGESLPQARDAQPSAEEELIHARNVLLAGTSVVSGEGRAAVFHTGMHTEFGKIAHLTQAAGEPVSPLQKEIVRLSRFVGVLAVALGIAFFFVGQAAGLSFWEDFIFAIGIIVANVPEGLLPTVTLSLAMATQRMAKRNALVRHLPSVETLGAATVICTDKTGTLTQNRMAARQIFLGNEIRQMENLDEQLAATYSRFWECAHNCQNLKETSRDGKQELLGDPTEIALIQMAERVMGNTAVYPKIDEVPFDTDRKRLSILSRTPEGNRLYAKGALEMLLPLCTRAQIGEETVPLTEEIRRRFTEAQETLAENGLRILALAHREVGDAYDYDSLEEDLTLTGLVGLEDPPRPEVPRAIEKCLQAGIKVIMVTGDHPHTAKAIAREIGLLRGNHPYVITGSDLRRLSNTQLQLALDKEEIIFARLGADQKMRIVEALKRKRHVVAVTGDGVNDAPALKAADIGIAMGIAGTDVAKESADMILLDDNFASIVSAIEEGRAVFDNIRKFMSYILTSNIPELVPYLAFALFSIPLPLTIIQILAVDLGTDMVPALGLGADRPDPACMKQPPRSVKEKLLSWPLVTRAYLFLGILEAIAAMAAFFYVLYAAGWHYGETLARQNPIYLQATTACLSAIIVMQVMNVFLCKHPDRSLFRSPIFNNRLILIGILLESILILVIDYTPRGNEIFGTAPIGLDVWLFSLPFALAMLLMEELRKSLARLMRRAAEIPSRASIRTGVG